MTTPQPPIRVGLYAGPGANPTLLHKTIASHGFLVSLLNQDELTQIDRATLDVIYLPGGWYTPKPAAVTRINDFVKTQAGGIVTTCAGAYVLIDTLKLIPGKTLRSNMRGVLFLEPKQGQHPILATIANPCTRHNDRAWEQIQVPHMGGPMILLDNPDHLIASYDAQGQIGAIACADAGLGRAVAISSHPECRPPTLSPDDPYTHPTHYQGDASLIIPQAIRWAAKQSG